MFKKRKKKEKAPETRAEHDSLGPVEVPAWAYFGAQTQRARENFPVSGIMPKPVFIRATAMVKKAAAEANRSVGLLDSKRTRAITDAADEVIEGLHHEHFVVDVYQAGAGTSHNMNANEVLANRAAEFMKGKRGEYTLVHPNDHVNMGQSTNDTFPTAMRVAMLLASEDLIEALKGLEKAFGKKASEFKKVIKSGRTHLQDAVPVRLGSEFASYASAIAGCSRRIKEAGRGLARIGLGATAAGTGLNSHPGYRDRAVKELKKASGLALAKAPDTHEALNSMADFSAFSGALRDAAGELTRISNDLRLLSSGPRTGLSEITLPAVQPGSSIMPGKVNPVMAEMMNMVCFQVVGNDLAASQAAQAGQMDLNVMGPVVNYNILQSMEILTNGVKVFTVRCISGIEARPERCRAYFESSVGLATVLNPYMGYEKASEVAKESEKTGKSIKEVVIEKGIMSEKEWAKLMDPDKVTAPMEVKAKKK